MDFDWRALLPEELERQFNPRVIVPDFQTYLDQTAADSRRARDSLPSHLDLRYGPGPRQTLDIFPAPTVGAPAVMFVHGGFWRALSKEMFSCLALALRPSGVATILVGYDLCPEVTLDRIVEEIAEAVHWCLDSAVKYGIDAGRIHVAGSSAGAHLLAMTLLRPGCTAQRHIRSACLASGIYDIRPVMGLSVNQAIRLDQEAALRNSPVLFPSKIATQLLIAVGEDESDAWVAQSLAFARACELAGCRNTFLKVDNANHFSLGLTRPGTAMNRALIDSVIAQELEMDQTTAGARNWLRTPERAPCP